VKVFLFKEGHIERYIKLEKYGMAENRSKFIHYAEKSMNWLNREIGICNPNIIILLGLEVTKVFFSLKDSESKEYLDGNIKTKMIDGIERNIICLPHPGILMKKSDANPWPQKFETEIAPNAKRVIEKILTGQSI
jgi:uracil-DNA glycosylase